MSTHRNFQEKNPISDLVIALRQRLKRLPAARYMRIEHNVPLRDSYYAYVQSPYEADSCRYDAKNKERLIAGLIDILERKMLGAPAPYISNTRRFA